MRAASATAGARPRAHQIGPWARARYAGENRGGTIAMKRSDRAYDSVGETEPYFGVISLDRYLSANLDAAALSEFFASGEAQVAQVLAMIRARFAADFKPRRALDFGCGVGRILIPLAREADHAIGVDVSDAMMAEAARNCRERGLANVSFVKSDDRLSRLEG